MNRLIFDRTETDVTYAKEHQSEVADLKGAYNYSDLNRIEEWCAYLKTELETAGYTINITTKTDWTASDFPTQAQLERIRSNVETIKTEYYSFTNVPNNMNKMTHVKANDIEKVLDEVNTLMESMRDYYIYAGVSDAGQERLWQNRFRRQYTPKWYLESTGTQWINTGIKSQVGIKIEMDFEPEAYGQCWCGSHYNTPNMSLLCKSNGTWGYIVSGTVYYGSTSVQLERQKISFEMNSDSQALKVNGTNALTSTKAISGVSNNNLYLFARSETTISGSSMKLYEAKIYLNDTLLRHFIPVKDIHGTACLYDLISQEYYYNAGTGNFNCV